MAFKYYPSNSNTTRTLALAVLGILAFTNLLGMFGVSLFNIDSFNIPLLNWTLGKLLNTVGLVWVFFLVKDRKV